MHTSTTHPSITMTIGKPAPPSVPQYQSPDFGFPEGLGSDPNIAAGRSGYPGEAGFPNPGAGRGGYTGGKEEYYGQPYKSYPSAEFVHVESIFGHGRLGLGRGGFDDGFGHRGGFGGARPGFGRGGFGGGFGRGEPGFRCGYPDEYEYVPGLGQGGFGRGGYGKKGTDVVDMEAVGTAGRNMDVGVGVLGM